MSHTYDPNVSRSIPINVKILQSHSKSRKCSSFPLDDSSLSLGVEMVKISRLKAMVFSLWIEKSGNKIEALTLKRGIYRFLIGLQ